MDNSILSALEVDTRKRNAAYAVYVGHILITYEYLLSSLARDRGSADQILKLARTYANGTLILQGRRRRGWCGHRLQRRIFCGAFKNLGPEPYFSALRIYVLLREELSIHLH